MHPVEWLPFSQQCSYSQAKPSDFTRNVHGLLAFLLCDVAELKDVHGSEAYQTFCCQVKELYDVMKIVHYVHLDRSKKRMSMLINYVFYM